MRATTKAKATTPLVRKPEGKPKVKLGTGKSILFTSDTLFDEDLKK